jgi:hypothetical protein
MHNYLQRTFRGNNSGYVILPRRQFLELRLTQMHRFVTCRILRYEVENKF